MATQRRFVLAAMAIGAGLCGPAGTSALAAERMAVTYTWTPTSGANWTTDANWSVGGMPASNYPGEIASDDIVVFAGCTATGPIADTTVTVGEIQVLSPIALAIASGEVVTTDVLDVRADVIVISGMSTGTLTVQQPDGLFIDPIADVLLDTNARLTLSGDAGGSLVHTVDGRLRLLQPGSELVIDHGGTDAEAILEGVGAIVSENAAAIIDIVTAAQDALISRIEIRGTLLFTGSGEFINQGEVHADDPANIVFDAGLTVSDIAGFRWYAENAALLFDEGFSLAGHFTYKGTGEFLFNQASTCYVTTGGLFDDGVQQIACGSQPFTFNSGSGFTFFDADSNAQECGGCP